MNDSLALYEEKAELLKALAHPVRLRIVRGLLTTGCHNVGCMEANIGQSQSCISQHLMQDWDWPMLASPSPASPST